MYNDTKVGRFEADSNSINVTLNPDILAGRTDRLRTKAPNPSETVRHEQAHQVTPNCGNLCVQATLEEDNKHKDIRVRISNASVFANFDRNKDKTAVVKFCTPLVCKDGNRRIQQENETSSDVKTDGDSSSTIAEELAPKTGESSASKGENFVEANQTENKVQHASLSSKINKTLRNLNCKSGSNKNHADRDRTNAEAELESLEATRTSLSIDDDTSGYHTSESPNIRVPDDYYVNDRVDESKRQECPATEAANDTLRILERLLEGTPEFEGRRSRSVPRGRSDREINVVKSNLSGPIRVDYSGAALTAADLTRPQFVRWLTEIKEKTQNVERHLAEINNTMRRTSLNGDVTINPISHNKSQEDCIELCHKLSSQNSVPQKSKKTTRKKKQDECSQIDILEFHKIATSTPKTSKNIELKSAEVERIANKMDGSSVEPRKSNVVFTERNQAFDTGKRTDKEAKDQQVSKNRCKESSGTQTKVTTAQSRNRILVDESTMFKPSKIHKLKNPASLKQTISKDEIFAAQSIPSESHKSSSRVELPPAGTSGRSFIPTRQTIPEKPRSTSKRRSTSLEIDLVQIEPASTSDDNENYSGVQRDRRPSFFLQNHVNPVSRSAEGKSRSVNSNRRASAQDSISFHTLHDTMDATGRTQNQSEFIEIEMSRETPKPFTLKAAKKSAKTEKSIAQESTPLVRVTSATNIYNKLSRDGSIDKDTRKMVPQKNRTNTPENPRPVSRSSRDSRSESVSPWRRVGNTIGKFFERRTPEIEYVNDRSLANDGRGLPRSSRIPAYRSRKRDSERELSTMNYGSNNSRMEHTETVGRTETRKNTDGHCSVHSNDMRTKAQQRSKSDTRESRSNAERGYR